MPNASNNQKARRVRILRLTLTIALGLAANAKATEVCMYELTVTSPDGKPLVSRPVAATQNGQQFASVTTDGKGIARICDSPATAPVHFHVGGDGCGATTVKGTPRWRTTVAIHVTLTNCQPESGLTYFPQRCFYRLRVLGRSGKPIQSALLSPAGTAREDGPPLSDSYGRISRTVPTGQSTRVVVAKQGYAPASLTQDCAATDTIVRDRVIALSAEPNSQSHRENE